ncbi:hypothetical protein BCEP27_80342 [Burkholderia cepacia]
MFARKFPHHNAPPIRHPGNGRLACLAPRMPIQPYCFAYLI